MLLVTWRGSSVDAPAQHPFKVWDNVVGPLHGGDGIEVDGQNLDVGYNSIKSAHGLGSNAITAFSSTSQVTIHNNTTCCTTVGVGLDGTAPGGAAEDPSTEAGMGNSIDVSGHTVQDTCQGITRFRQQNDYIDGNEIYNDNANLTPDEPDGTAQQRWKRLPRHAGQCPR